MKASIRVFAVALASTLASCAGMIPIPTAKHTPKEYGTRGEIEKRYLKFLDEGATRVDVLLGLGEPDNRTDRYFFYRWITARGRMPMWVMSDSGGGNADVVSLGKKRHDLVIEFDDDGRVLRHGDIRLWTTKKVVDPSPFDLDTPLEVSVGHRHEGSSPPAGMMLLLEKDSLEFVGDPIEGHDVRIGVPEIVLIEYGSRQDFLWKQQKFTVDVRYLRDGKREVLRLFVALPHLPPLLDWVRLTCPDVTINT